ncbi:MAG: hypothetical protein QM781_17260 [Chitinophagaceae bacterium]
MKLLYGLLLILSFSGKIQAQQLEKIWETDKIFSSPESVMYDSASRLIYVSSINGNSGDKDGNGFISRLYSDGSVKDLHWIKGLDAPKGMAVYNNRLYVADIDHLVEIDRNTGSILNRYTSADAVFLNDVAVSGDGIVYVSDSRANRIFRLKESRLDVWLTHPEFSKTNGLLVRGRYLYIGSTVIHRVNRRNKRIKVIQEDCEGIDGLVENEKRELIFSNWFGRIVMRKQRKLKVLLYTKEQQINTADIFYSPELKLLLVPTFLDNRVLAYRINY